MDVKEEYSACCTLPEDSRNALSMDWLAEQMPGGFFIYRADEGMHLLFANSALFRIYGCENPEQFQALCGGTFQGMVHPEDFEEIQASILKQISVREAEGFDHVEYRIVRRDGSVRWVDDYGRHASLPGYGDVFYVFVSDITQRRQEREEKARVELELERQKRAAAVKSDFLFNISHDIRTPMNAVVGFLDMARRRLDEPERLRECLERAKVSSDQMLELLDDLLEMSNLESGQVQLKAESCDLREVLSGTVDLFRPQAEEKKLTLEETCELPAGQALTDPGRLRRVLANLLSNAVKFTPPGGTVRLRAAASALSDSGFARCTFTVSDTGVGMSEEFMGRIFTAFEREASSTEAGISGAGLGLSIAKRLTDIMGGTLSAQSRKGEGAVFVLELPLKFVGSAPEPYRPPPVVQAAGGGRRLLLVEDIELNRILAEAVLEEAGFRVESVANGSDAVEAVSSHPPHYYDLVLMDIQMPIMNGYEATRAIRALGRADSARLPIVALSANAREEDRSRSLESGMNHHIAKPFDAENLISVVNRFIDAAWGDAPPETPQ